MHSQVIYPAANTLALAAEVRFVVNQLSAQNFLQRPFIGMIYHVAIESGRYFVKSDEIAIEKLRQTSVKSKSRRWIGGNFCLVLVCSIHGSSSFSLSDQCMMPDEGDDRGCTPKPPVLASQVTGWEDADSWLDTLKAPSASVRQYSPILHSSVLQVHSISRSSKHRSSCVTRTSRTGSASFWKLGSAWPKVTSGLRHSAVWEEIPVLVQEALELGVLSMVAVFSPVSLVFSVVCGRCLANVGSV